MPLTITLSNSAIADTGNLPIEVDGITPDRLVSMPLSDIPTLPIHHGNRILELGDLFSVSGDPTDGNVHWQGNLASVHGIGRHMKSGAMSIESNVGRHVGSEMQGGSLTVVGDAGDFAGCEMSGGTIRIHGSAGNLVGAAYRGSPRGMRGGRIFVDGNAGSEIGHSMRRGMIVVAGDSGDAPGYSMLAGTIIINGRSGIRPGAGMRRGTIILNQLDQPELLPTFSLACETRPEIFRILQRDLHSTGFDKFRPIADQPFAIFNGDQLEGGRGEIFTRI